MRWLAGTILAMAALLWAGCELGSPDTAVRASTLSVGGLYRDSAGGAIVSQSTGGTITQFNVIQRGDQLQAIDNLGHVYGGTLSDNGYFELKGIGPGGFEVTMSGTFTTASSTLTMSGSWIEPSRFATIRATATASSSSGTGTNSNSNTNTNAA